MTKVLITGATGNVGKALLAHLNLNQCEVTCAVRKGSSANASLAKLPVERLSFDFETGEGFSQAKKYDVLFLLRPPQIGDVQRYVFPLLQQLQAHNTTVVFLSVQGAEQKSFIPHAKIEAEINRLQLPSIILRPSYFLDNLTTTLADEFKRKQRIFMPSGQLAFNWISADSIGKAAAKLISDYPRYQGQCFELTGSEIYNFQQVIECINQQYGSSLRYQSANVFRYVVYQRKLGTSWAYIGVMLLLHFLPRFEAAANISTDYQELMAEPPETMAHFVVRNAEFFKSL